MTPLITIMQTACTIADNTKQIYDRSTKLAMSSSNTLLATVEADRDTKNCLLVQTAALAYRDNAAKYEGGEVDMQVLS